jgi:hypothetical protein
VRSAFDFPAVLRVSAKKIGMVTAFAANFLNHMVEAESHQSPTGDPQKPVAILVRELALAPNDQQAVGGDEQSKAAACQRGDQNGLRFVPLFHHGISVGSFHGSGLLQEARQSCAQLAEQFFGFHWLRFGVLLLGPMADDAALDMIVEQFDPERIERGTDGGDLIEDVHAVAILRDHSLNAGDLPGDALYAPFDFGSGFRLHCLQLPRMGIWSRLGVSCSIGRCTNVSPAKRLLWRARDGRDPANRAPFLRLGNCPGDPVRFADALDKFRSFLLALTSAG